MRAHGIFVDFSAPARTIRQYETAILNLVGNCQQARTPWRLVDIELACTRQTGGTHLKGWATFVAPN